MAWGAIIGAGASLLGSALGGGKSGSKFRFNPQNANIAGLGSARFSKRGGLNVSGTAFDTQARGFFQDQFAQAASDPNQLQAYGTGLIGQAQGMFGPSFQASQAAGFDPTAQALAQLQGGMAGTGGLLNQAGLQGFNAAFGAPSAAGFAGTAGQTAMGLLGQTDLGQLAADRTAQLTALARPQEETAVNQKFSSLFGRGQLGTSGGAQALGQLQQQQNLAATQRGLAGMDFAEQQRLANLQQAQGFLGQGLQGIGQDQQMAQFLGQLGQGALGQNIGLQQQLFQNQFGLNEAQVGRADQRLDRVQGLFGFGAGLQEQPVAQAARTLQGTAGIDERLLGLGDLSVRASSAASGTQTSGGSPIGNAILGAGSGLFQAGIQKALKD
jgi:hypothetical protein